MKGILLIDKPTGMTSHDVVDRIRKAAGIRRVGHTGTLDPGATGLLILCLGTATRLSEHLTLLDKVYEGYMRMGTVTDSYDRDGAIQEENPVPKLQLEDIQDAMNLFKGDIMQVPPMVSAVKVGGERLYKRARKGETVERKARPVTISEFSILAYEEPLAKFRIRCTRGTYVRSLCHEIGQILNCGAILDSLRRTAVGKHSVEDAHPLNAILSEEHVRAALIPINKVLDLPEVIVHTASKRLVASGTALLRKDLTADCPVQEGWVQIKDRSGELLALGERVPPEDQLLPRRVFMRQS